MLFTSTLHRFEGLRPRGRAGVSLLLAAVGLIPSVWAASPADAPRLDPALIAKTPIRFERSLEAGGKRQATHPDEQWIGRGTGFSAGISRDGAILQAGTRRFQIRFAGSDPNAPFLGERKSATPTNYFTGVSGKADAIVNDAYLALRRQGVYPGVDLVYYGTGQGIEYDFELAAGADPSQIRIAIDGVDGLGLDEAGDLILTLDGKQISHQAPAVYQRTAPGELTAVKSFYYPEDDGAYSIRLGDYDAAKPVVIDPQVLFTAYLAGGGTDAPVGIGFDENDTLYIAGYTYSTDFPLVGEAYSPVVDSANRFIFTTKMNPLGAPADVITYSGIFGATFNDYLTAMTVSPSGVFYLTGYTDNFYFPMTDSGYMPNNGEVTRMFFSAIDSNLPGKTGLIYSTFFGGARQGHDDPSTPNVDESTPAPNPDVPYAIAYHNGHVYIAGNSNTDDYPLKNPIQDTRAGQFDLFLAEFDPSQSGEDSLVNSTYLGGTEEDDSTGIAVDPDGNVYVTGYTGSSDFPTTVGSFKPFYSGGDDAFVTKLNLTSAQILYSTYLGTIGVDHAFAIQLDPANRVAVTGVTTGADFPMTQDAYQPVYGGSADVFFTILDLSQPDFPNQLAYSTYYGGSDGDVPYSLALGSDGSYYFSGYTLSRDLPVQDAIQSFSNEASYDGFVAILNPSRPPFHHLIYSSYVTGGGVQIASHVGVDSNGNVYVVGETNGNIFEQYQATPPDGSGLNVFVYVFRPSDSAAQQAPDRLRNMTRHSDRVLRQ